jgi:hypothetical protein
MHIYNFIGRLVKLLLFGFLFSGCVDHFNRDLQTEFILINETDISLHMSYYYYSTESSSRLWEANANVAINDTIYFCASGWNSKYYDESDIFDNCILHYPREDTRIVFSNDAGTPVTVWYAKDADAQPGNFFRQDSWDYKKEPYFAPYSDGVSSGNQIVWTFHIKKNQ